MPERRRYKVEWSPAAKEDVERLAAYLAEEAPLRAESVIDRILTRADSLASFPHRGRAVLELHGIADRSWRELQAPPWRIIYQVHTDRRVMIHAVLDGRRDLDDLLFERLISS